MQHKLLLAISIAAASAALAPGAWAGCRLTVRSATGALVARIGADGMVRTPEGALLGTLGPTVRDRRGALVGAVDDQGTLRDGKGRILARLTTGGELRDASGALILRVDLRGRVRTPSGKLLGWFEGYAPACLHLAAAYLIFFNSM